MFGYVVPLKGELKVRELEAYQGIYCGLCHTLGRRYGFFPRLLLSYDFAFLAMALAPPDEEMTLERKRCVACPLRGKKVCPPRGYLDTAADESVVLTYWKLRDSVEDQSFLRGLPARILSACLRPAYRKAARRRPDFDRQTVACLEELRALERDKSASLDRPADTFARILSASAPATGEPARDRTAEQLLYHVGRWIYLADAWDDLNEDRADGRYNPLLARFLDGPENHQTELRLTMKHSLNLAVSAFNLLESNPWSGILMNILCLGLPAVEESVFSGQWRRERKKTGRRSYERSI